MSIPWRQSERKYKKNEVPLVRWNYAMQGKCHEMPGQGWRCTDSDRFLRKMYMGTAVFPLHTGPFLFQVLQPSAREKYPAFTFMQGHGRDYDLSAGLTPEKREWPFIRDPRRAAATAGDFVLLWQGVFKTANFPLLMNQEVTLSNYSVSKALCLRVLWHGRVCNFSRL